MSEDMSPYCSAHDEWLIMKLYMYVSNFGGDPVTQLHFKNVLYYYVRCFADMALNNRDAFTVSAAVGSRSRADCSMQYGRPSPYISN